MNEGFLGRYFDAFDRIPGWFLPDAYLLVAAYTQLLADHGLAGDVLEIGVYHGKSAIGVAALRGKGRRFVGVDLFDTPTDIVFLENMARFHDDLSFVTTIAAPSATVRAAELGSGFTLCHVDGSHGAPDVYADLELCVGVSSPGSLIVLDDYSSPAFPGVAEGALRFQLDAPGTLRPIAIGFNKAVFQREPAPFALNARLFEVFPQMRSQWALLWDVSVPWFATSLLPFFDLERSAPGRLVSAATAADAPVHPDIAARIEPASEFITACAGRTIALPIEVTNLSGTALSCDEAPFGLSYHLLTGSGALLKYDNPRTYFVDPLLPGCSRIVDVAVQVPDQPGGYLLEFDIVWEGILWLKDRGNGTGRVRLSVTTTSQQAGAGVTAVAGAW